MPATRLKLQQALKHSPALKPESSVKSRVQRENHDFFSCFAHLAQQKIMIFAFFGYARSVGLFFATSLAGYSYLTLTRDYTPQVQRTYA